MGIIYFVEMRAAEQRNVLCRWVEHYYETGTRAQVMADSTVTAQHLDQLLWSFSQPSFIPHRVLGAWDGKEPREPVIISVGEIFVPGFPVLLCDAPAGLEFMARYELAVHFVTVEDEDQRQRSRDLWQAAKTRGIDLKHVPFAKQMQPPARV